MMVFDQIKQSVNCNDLVLELGLHVTAGNMINCPDPAHADKHPSCQVNREYLYCHGCRRSWTAIDLVMEVKGWDLITAARWLADRAGVPWPEQSEEARQEYEQQLNRLTEMSKRLNCWAKNLRDQDREYLKRRGFTEEFIKKQSFGYCGQKLPQGLAAARELGLLIDTKDGRSWYIPHGRIVIPFYQYGKPIQVAFHKPGERGGGKYLYPAGWAKPLIGSYKRGETPILSEGIFDYFSLVQAGLPALCSLGTRLSEKQREQLAKVPGFYVCFDSDEPGRKAALELAKEFYPAAKIINLLDGKDLNDLLRELGQEQFKEYILQAVKEAKNYLDLVTAQLEQDPHSEEVRAEAMLFTAKLASGIDRDLKIDRLVKTLKPLGITKAAIRQEVDRLRKELEAQAKQGEPQEEQEKEIEYIAEFPGLVDICEDTRTGEPCFLIAIRQGEKTELQVLSCYEDPNGKRFYPPPREQMPWLLVDVEQAIKHYSSDNDNQLYKDLVKHYKSISELPSEDHYKLLAWWTLHTYLYDKGEYSPYLWFYAVPERGKSRTCKAMIHLAWRGVHVESLRDPYIVRISNNFGSSLFFDCIDLWYKAEKQGTEDVLLLRFEKGAVVPRVLFPERGPFKDTVYYKIFGPTLIATNKEVHHILKTRAIQINMPASRKQFNNDVKPENALGLKSRLVAFRARHLFDKLPDADKPTSGRLGDIMRPILQIVKLVSPEDQESFKNLLSEIEEGRRLEKSSSWEAQIIQTIIDLKDEIESGVPPLLPQKVILEKYNEGVREEYQISSQGLGHRLKALGFESKKMGDGRMGVVWNEELLASLCIDYNLEHGMEKLRNLRNEQEANNDGGFSAGGLPEVTEDIAGALNKPPAQEALNSKGFGGYGDYGDFSRYGGDGAEAGLTRFADDDPY